MADQIVARCVSKCMEVFRRMLGWCWKWSGCPLVVLVAVPVLALHTRHLAGPLENVDDHSGASIVATEVTRLLAGVVPQYGISQWAAVEWIGVNWSVTREIDNSSQYSMPGRELLFVSVRGQLIIDGHQRPERHGLWAPTRIQGAVNYNLRPWNTAPPYDSDMYRSFAEEYGRQSRKPRWSIQSAIAGGRGRYLIILPGGYFHNAIALILVCMIGRGVWRSHKWIRSRRNA